MNAGRWRNLKSIIARASGLSASMRRISPIYTANSVRPIRNGSSVRTLDDLPVVDSTGYPVDIGSEIDGGNGVTGEVVAFPQVDEPGIDQETLLSPLEVEIEWPDRDFSDRCITRLAFAGGYTVLLCPEITSIDSEAPDEPDGRRYEFSQN